MGDFKGAETSPSPNLREQRIPNADSMCLTPAQTQHVYECINKEITYDPTQVPDSFLNTLTFQDIFQESSDSDEFYMVTEYNSYMDELIDYGMFTFTSEEIDPDEMFCEDTLMHNDVTIPTLRHTQPDPSWSVFTNCLMYTSHPDPPTNHIAGKGCMDFDPVKMRTKITEFSNTDTLMALYEDLPSDYTDSLHPASCQLQFNTSYNDDVDLSTTYLGTDVITPSDKFHPECRIPFNIEGRTQGETIGGVPCHILIDTGASKSYMSKSYYLANPSLHSYPKFVPKCGNIQVGNGAIIQSLFVIPILIRIAGHKFEIYTLITDIHANSDLIIGLKNLFELEGQFDCRTRCLRFLNRSLPIFPLYSTKLRPGMSAYLKCKVPFVSHLSGIAVVKLMHEMAYGTLKAKFINNFTIIQVTNNTDSTIYFTPDQSLGIVDIRSLGYYNMSLNSLSVNPSALTLSCLQPTSSPVCLHAACVKRGSNIITEGQTQPPGPRHDTDSDPFPWLDHDDPRKTMSDEEILYKYIDLSDSDLTDTEKHSLMAIIIQNKSAFSLRDEIGQCPDITIDIDVIDASPFFVRPFPIAEKDKILMDAYMKKLVELGILTKNSTTHTSPVMLISRKGTTNKRPVVDFRLLNTRILRRNTSTPLMRDIFNILGKSKCQVLSCVDLKDAYHSIKLTDKAKEYCGILPYFGSPHYRYEVLPMGLSISPQVWIDYIENVLQKIPSRQNYLAIMDDLLIHGMKSDHFSHFEVLLKTISEHGLKLSPRKCQLFRKHLVYMGNEFSIEDDLITIKPLRTRIEAIQKFPPPKTVTQCKRFCGMVNYMSLFCKDLQAILSPIYHLTKKGVPFLWTDLQQNALDKIKELLISSPVLFLPIPGGRFILYCDTSRTHTGSSLWQIQKGKPRLVGYASKCMPPAAANYSVTELEMTGLSVNIHLWRFLVYRNEFDCAVDHAALPYIMKAKTPPASPRIMRLLEILSNYGFNLYYVKGKDMKIADFLSRIDVDSGNPHEVIPISFCCLTEIQKNKDFIDNGLFILTRSKARDQNLDMPPVHGPIRGHDPGLKPEHQHRSTKPLVGIQQKSYSNMSPAQRLRHKLIQRSIKTLQRAALKRQQTIPQTNRLPNIPLPRAVPRRILPSRPIPLPAPGHPQLPTDFLQPDPVNHDNIPPQSDPPPRPRPVESPPIRPTSGPPIRPSQPAGPHQIVAPPQVDPYESGLELPFTDESVIPTFRTPSAYDFALPPLLGDQIYDPTLYHKYLPKQADIDKILTQIGRKYLKQMHLPCSIRDMQAAYLSSPHFKDIYNRIFFNRLPSNKMALKNLRKLDESDFYMIHSGLLYKYHHTSMNTFEPVLCVPQTKIQLFLAQFHSSLIGGHMGMSKVFRTLAQKFYCPNLPHFVRMYIIACHKCQLFKTHKKFDRTFNQRVRDISTPALVHVSMDIKHMPPANGWKFILVLLCEISNFLVAAPLKSATSVEVCTAIFDQFVAYFGCPVRIICDQDPAFMSTLSMWFFQQYGIKIIVVSPTNHKSLLAEHGIKSLSNLLMKHMTDIGPKWNIYLKPSMLTYNSYCSPNLDNLSPFQVAFGRQPILVPQLEITPTIPISGTMVKHVEILRQKLTYVRQKLIDFRNKRQAIMNKDKEFHSFGVGQIVYLSNPRGSMLQTSSKKFQCEFVGPLVIYKCVSPNQFLLCSLDGIPYHMLVEETRLKPGWIHTIKGPVNNLADLVKISRTNLALPGVL